MDRTIFTIFAKTKVAKVDLTAGLQKMAISAHSAIYSASKNMIGRANRTFICIQCFKTSVNINRSTLSADT